MVCSISKRYTCSFILLCSISLSGGLCLWSHFRRHLITPTSAESTLISTSKVLSGSHITTVFHGAPSKLWHITHTHTCAHTHPPQRLTLKKIFFVAFFWCWICLQEGNTCCKQPLHPHLWTFSSIFQDFSYILVPSKTCSEKYFVFFRAVESYSTLLEAKISWYLAELRRADFVVLI